MAYNTERILLVDDDAALIDIFYSLIKDHGYSVEVATSGDQALNKIREETFSLVILDIKLPDTSGLQVLKKLREKGEQCSIVLITGFPQFQECIDALHLGVYEILL